MCAVWEEEQRHKGTQVVAGLHEGQELEHGRMFVLEVVT